MIALAIFVALLPVAGAQTALDPVKLFVTGTSFSQGKASCPVFVGHVAAGSPGERAGIQPGDILVAIDGKPVKTMSDARALRSDHAGSVEVELLRDGIAVKVTATREPMSASLARAGKKLVGDGFIVPANASEAEVKQLTSFDSTRIVARVFPSHYPKNESTYYAGFEIFVLRDPAEIAVGGIEEGPATQAGVHWGDVILAVDGIEIRDKSVAELEKLFSGTSPRVLRLKLRRVGEVKEFTFSLARAGEVLRLNQKRLYQGQPLPLVPDKYVQCFAR